jgi:hypothetical protein
VGSFHQIIFEQSLQGGKKEEEEEEEDKRAIRKVSFW